MNKRKFLAAAVAAFLLVGLSIWLVGSRSKLYISEVKALSAIENPATGTCCPGGEGICVIGDYMFDNRYYQAEGPCKKE